MNTKDLHLYQQMIAKRPDDAHLWTCFANVLQHGHGDMQGSIRAYKRVLELQPSNAAAFNNLGFLEINANDNVVAAEGCYRRAIQLDPADPNALVNLGVLLSHQTQPPDYDGAERRFREALRVRPDHLAALVNYGNLLVERPLDEPDGSAPPWPPEPAADGEGAGGLVQDWRTGRYAWEESERRHADGESRRSLVYASMKARAARPRPPRACSPRPSSLPPVRMSRRGAWGAGC
jgi:tetratricopeptide (TPR) repeat protein